MSYSARIQLAAIAALALHLAFGVGFGVWLGKGEVDLYTGGDPFILNLQAPEERLARRLVETGAPAMEPPSDTDLISAEDTQAQAPGDITDDSPQAGVEEESDFEKLATPLSAEPLETAPPPAPEPNDSPPPTPEASPEQAESEEVLELEPATEPVEDLPAELSESNEILVAEAPKPSPQDKTEALAEKEPVEDPPVEEPVPDREPPVKELPERFDVAEAPLIPPFEQNFPQKNQGRAEKGAAIKGPLSFAANQHELAQYMAQVQQRVELVWRSVLRFRYSGTNQATAVLECSISSTGQVTSVTIADEGNSFIYAALCKEAILKAAPFRPFPFDVPEIYRSQDLKVSWTFTFK